MSNPQPKPLLANNQGTGMVNQICPSSEPYQVSTSKRFIAGAICPQCKELDVIFIYEREGSKYQACVECGYSKAMDETIQQSEQNKVASEHSPNPVQIIKLINNPKDPSR